MGETAVGEQDLVKAQLGQLPAQADEVGLDLGLGGSSQPWRLSSSQGEPLTRCRERPGSSRPEHCPEGRRPGATVYGARPGVSFRARRTSFSVRVPGGGPGIGGQGRAET